MNLRLQAAAVSALGVALIGAVVACSPSSVAAPDKPGGPNDPFVKCMTENGVPAPQGPPPQGGPGGHGGQPGDPPPAPPGVDQSVWDKGLQACASLAPTPPPQH
ncbi:hypothetical protein ORI20_00870 [Mycobacterium sp. CVI_P3]|uniref:Lipoprotein n=1 Tax=Mycobacterium pinniadriaticum TaxID=2994102 RepID=A0ABT3S765_9MYCO|nr:hypothetical protein [Mycobacterium pinniadriaticum]MCX2928806.1 hypothetical protein [Mycobacterium pinniadriaticum]MCX2935327.1 hypothetical protein [Mycobacterium pinniadriaticum]